MAKKDLTSLSSEQNLVQKANPLLTIGQEFSLPLGSCKLLDFYLSQIDMHNPEQRDITISRTKLQNIFGLKYLDKDILRYNLQALRRINLSFIGTDVKTGKRGEIDTSLFEYSFLEEGLDYVRLACTEYAMKYVFNIENIGYLRYRFQSIKELRSIYSYHLFTYIGKNRFRKEWEDTYDNLRKELNIQEEEYDSFNRFKTGVLERAKKELSEKTLCQFEYETIKDGREVVGLRFRVLSSGDFEIAAGSTGKLKQLEKKKEKNPKKWLEIIKNNINADSVASPSNQAELDAILSVMVETMMSDTETMKVGDIVLPAILVQEKLLELKEEHIRHAIDVIQANRKGLKNAKAYIRTVLYNAAENTTLSQASTQQHSSWIEEAIEAHKRREKRQK